MEYDGTTMACNPGKYGETFGLVGPNLLTLAHRFDAGDFHAYASAHRFSAQAHGTFGLSAYERY
jgi:hypothetical protein